jgi:hypothetical protein
VAKSGIIATAIDRPKQVIRTLAVMGSSGPMAAFFFIPEASFPFGSPKWIGREREPHGEPKGKEAHSMAAKWAANSPGLPMYHFDIGVPPRGRWGNVSHYTLVRRRYPQYIRRPPR